LQIMKTPSEQAVMGEKLVNTQRGGSKQEVSSAPAGLSQRLAVSRRPRTSTARAGHAALKGVLDGGRSHLFAAGVQTAVAVCCRHCAGFDCV